MSEILRKAEKAYNVNPGSGTSVGAGHHQSQSHDQPLTQDQRKVLLGEVDSNIVLFYKTKLEFMRLLSHVEAKLLGKADEMLSLESYVRTTPKVGNIDLSSSSSSQMADGDVLLAAHGTVSSNNNSKRGRDDDNDGGGRAFTERNVSKRPKLDAQF